MYDKSDMAPCAGASLALDVCTHPGVMGGMCIRCGQKVEDESGVAFGYIHKVILHDLLFTKIHLCIHIFFSGGWVGGEMLRAMPRTLPKCRQCLSDPRKVVLFGMIRHGRQHFWRG